MSGKNIGRAFNISGINGAVDLDRGPRIVVSNVTGAVVLQRLYGG